MANLKDCPRCGLVNPPETLRCDCGYNFATQRVLGLPTGSQDLGSSTGCQGCGVEAETRYVSFHQNIGAFALRFHSSVDGWLCKSCIHRHFWGKTLTTLVLGWWGVISFIVTPFILLNNIGRYLFCLGMTPPPTREAANASRPGGGRWSTQLVGQNCVHCGERIPSDLDGRFCRGCGAPSHDRCVRPGGATGCPVCGASVPPPQ
jgi:hypothetical protein